MDKIVEVHEEDMDVVVQPSVCWVDLNRELERKGTGLFFPIDPGKYSSIQVPFAVDRRGFASLYQLGALFLARLHIRQNAVVLSLADLRPLVRLFVPLAAHDRRRFDGL